MADNPIVEPESLFYNQEEPKEALEVAEEKPEEVDAEDEEAEDAEESDAESEESEGEEESEDDTEQEESDDESYVEIDGREITLAQIKDWESGSLRQSDYTQKTQALASERKEFEAEKETLVSNIASEKFKALDESIIELETMIKSDDEDIDWKDLREYDPDEYLKKKEQLDKRKDALAKAKDAKVEAEKTQKQTLSNVESKAMADAHPEWFKDGKTTEAYTKQMGVVNEYFTKNGWTAEDQNAVSTAKSWEAIIQAANIDAKKAKASKTKQKIRKLPITTKPSKKSQNKSTPIEDVFYG